MILRIPILLLRMMIGCVSSTFGQLRPRVPFIPAKDTSMFWIFKDVTAGPYFTGGFSRQNEKLPGIPGDTINPWHSESRFAFTLGAEVEFSINKWIGLAFGAFYDSRDIYLASRGDSDNIDLNIGYIALQPSIRIAWLVVALAFDISMYGNAPASAATYTLTSP